MALQIAKETPSGVSVEYWRINPVMTIDMVERKVYARLMAYVSQAARTGGKREVAMANEVVGFDDVQRIVLDGADFRTALAAGEFRDVMYAKLKTEDFFSGADDV